jgi:hypothetical protein
MRHAGKGVFDRMRRFRFGTLAAPVASPLLATALAAVAMMGVLVWSGDFAQYFPETGWEFDAGLSDRITILTVGVLFGMLVPLEAAAISKARNAARAAGAGGVLGPVFGILSMSCCAPLLAPALLSFVGFSGGTLLNVNAALHELSTPLTLLSLALLLLSIALVSHSVAAACRIDVDSPTKGRQPVLR